MFRFGVVALERGMQVILIGKAGDQALIAFGRFCTAQEVDCLHINDVVESVPSVAYESSGPVLSLAGNRQLFSRDILGVWFRDLPAAPESPDDAEYVEAERWAFWAAYLAHLPVPVLNRLNAPGLRPSTWTGPALRCLVAEHIGLRTPFERIARFDPVAGDAESIGLSTRDRVIAGDETCLTPKQKLAYTTLFVAHAGEHALVKCADAADGDCAEVAAEASRHALSVANLLGESFGVAKFSRCWDGLVFEGYTPNPPADLLLRFEPGLFSLILRALAGERQ